MAETDSNSSPEFETQEISVRDIQERMAALQAQVEYRCVPHGDAAGSARRPVWRLRFDPVAEDGDAFGLDVNGEVVFGIETSEVGGYVGLSTFDGENLGVSRRHMMLRPTSTRLYAVDLNSTNGTYLNGRSIGINTPYSISNGDVLSLGSLQFIIRIIQRPATHITELHEEANLGNVLTQMAKAITSQLELDEVLNRALEMAMSLTQAGEVSVLLADQMTGQLFIEAERSLGDEKARHERRQVQDELASTVVQDGKPQLTSHRPDEHQHKAGEAHTGNAHIYVPLALGGQSFGVLVATHGQPESTFGDHEERLLSAIADFAAIALQNSRLYEAMRDADRLKDEMIQNISHEFRTPLGLIMGYAGFMIDDADSAATLSEEQLSHITTVQKHAYRMEWLVNNFIALQTTQDVKPVPEPTEIRTLLQDALQSAQLQSDAARVPINLSVPAGISRAMIDPMAIGHVLDNLLSNALKFTPPGGHVELLAEQASATELHISVKDTGIGIPDDARELIFEKFVQVDGTSTRRYGGVGLGLTVCKTIVEAHGKEIWVESEPGEGATFVFSLPVVG